MCPSHPLGSDGTRTDDNNGRDITRRKNHAGSFPETTPSAQHLLIGPCCAGWRLDRQNRRTPASYASLISPKCARKTARCSFSAMSTLAHCYVMQCGSISGSRFRISSLTHMRSCDATQPTLPSFFFLTIRSLRFPSYSISCLLTRLRDPEERPAHHLSLTLEQNGFITNFCSKPGRVSFGQSENDWKPITVVYQISFSWLLLIVQLWPTPRPVVGKSISPLDLILLGAG